MIPASTRALTQSRPPFPATPAAAWPLVNIDGKPWWQVKAERDAALKDAA